MDDVRLFLLTFSVNEPLSRGRIRRGQLLFDLGNVLGVKVVKQALTYQVILETAGGIYEWETKRE